MDIQIFVSYNLGMELKMNKQPKKMSKKNVIFQLNTPDYLYIYTKKNYLAVSPDGLIGNDTIIEIKYPQSV